MFSSKFHLQCARLGAKVSTGLLATLLVLGLCAGIADPVKAQDLRVKAEAEGKLMLYATFNAAGLEDFAGWVQTALSENRSRPFTVRRTTQHLWSGSYRKPRRAKSL